MKAGAVLVALATLAFAATFAWAKSPSSSRDLVHPKAAPLESAAGKVRFVLTATGRMVEFKLRGLEKGKRYAVRFNQDEHPVIKTGRANARGRALIRFNNIKLPFGILEPISNRPVEVVTLRQGHFGEQVLVGRIPIIDGFPYWGQSTTSGNNNGTRLPDVDRKGPFAVESAPFALPQTSGGLPTGTTVVWYPGAGGVLTNGASAPYPPVVFAHAPNFRAADYADWGQTIASWGFVVLVQDNDDSPPSAVPDGQYEVRTTLGAMTWLVGQNNDASSRFFGKLDVQKFGFVGHSLGGGAALVAAAHSASQGRVKAAVGLGPQALFVQSGLGGEYIPYSPDATSGYWPPTLVLTGTQDGFADPTLARTTFFDPAPRPRGVVQITGHCSVNYADHVPTAALATSDYDPSTCEDAPLQLKVARTYVTPWLLHYLRNDDRVTDYVDGTFAAEQGNVVDLSFD